MSLNLRRRFAVVIYQCYYPRPKTVERACSYQLIIVIVVEERRSGRFVVVRGMREDFVPGSMLVSCSKAARDPV